MTHRAITQPPGSGGETWMEQAYGGLDFAVGVIGPDGQWTYLNPEGLAFMGVANLAVLSGLDAKDWGGRLHPLPSEERAENDRAFFFDARTDRIFTRHVAPLAGGAVEALHDVTELYEADERVRIMIDSAPLCCNFWNEKFENVDCNLEAAKLFDLPDKQAYLDNFFKLSPEVQPNGKKSADEAFRHITNAFRHGYERFDWMHQKLNGDPVPAEITLVRVKTRKGNTVLGYTRDRRSTTTMAAVDDLDWLTDVFNALPFPTGVSSTAGKWLYVNKKALAFFGAGQQAELSDVSAKDWGGRLKPLPAMPGDEDALYYYLDASEDRIYRRQLSPLHDNLGGVVGHIDVLQDVTSAYEAEERLRAMIDAAPLCCNYWNEKFENIDCNLEAPKLFDLPSKKDYLERFFELSPAVQPGGKPSSEEAVRHITTAFREGYDRFEWMHQKPTGEPIPAEITLVRVNLRKGAIVLGYTRDLRARKK